MPQECIHGDPEGCIRCAMNDPGYQTPITHVALIVDCSGSMSSRLKLTLDGLNEYIDSLRSHENIQYLISLTTFGNDTENVFESIPLQEIPKLNGNSDSRSGTYHTAHLKIRGTTALYDAVGQTLEQTEKETAKHPGTSVLFQVITDGQENASTQWDKKKLSGAISRATATGNWTFTFTGCDIDAWGEASSLGMTAGNTQSVNASNYGGTFAALTRSTARYARSRAMSFQAGLTRGVSSCDTKFAVSNYFDPDSGSDEETAPVSSSDNAD